MARTRDLRRLSRVRTFMNHDRTYQDRARTAWHGAGGWCDGLRNCVVCGHDLNAGSHLSGSNLEGHRCLDQAHATIP